MDVINWLQDNTFWCARGIDAVQCAGLLQARAIVGIGLLLFFALLSIAGKLKRHNRFAEARFSDHRQAFAQFLLYYLNRLGEVLEKGSTSLPVDGPLTREEWQNRALVPQKLRIELDKLLALIVTYNQSLQKAADATLPKAELSAKGPVDTSRISADVKKQLVKCQKMAAAIR